MKRGKLKFKDWGRRELYQHFAERGFRRGCEVGVFTGINAKHMFELIPDLYLLLVEPYSRHPQAKPLRFPIDYDEIRNKAVKRLDGLNFDWLIGFSEHRFDDIADESLDFVYIDGDHTYNFVMLDIILWTRKVRPGGIVSGHDFGLGGVKPALMDYCKANKIGPIYVTKKTTDMPTDRLSSWYFEKGE